MCETIANNIKSSAQLNMSYNTISHVYARDQILWKSRL